LISAHRDGRRAGPRGLSHLPAIASAAAPASAATLRPAGLGSTTTPIKHVVVIIGENHTFDNVFATYQPPRGQHVDNLLPEGIVTASGGLRPHAKKAEQLTASVTKAYLLSPTITGAYTTLPQPNTTYVATGCDGQAANTPDKRFPANLPNGPFQITKYVPYDDSHLEYTGGCEFYGAFVGDPLHRFYQRWQQTADNNKLFTWTAPGSRYSECADRSQPGSTPRRS
jgi:phospholipase C